MLTNRVFAEKSALNTYSVIKCRFMCFIWQESLNFSEQKAYKLDTNPIFLPSTFSDACGLRPIPFSKTEHLLSQYCL